MPDTTARTTATSKAEGRLKQGLSMNKKKKSLIKMMTKRKYS